MSSSTIALIPIYIACAIVILRGLHDFLVYLAKNLPGRAGAIAGIAAADVGKLESVTEAAAPVVNMVFHGNPTVNTSAPAPAATPPDAKPSVLEVAAKVGPAIALVVALAIGSQLMGCAWWQKHEAALTADGAADAECVLAHYQQLEDANGSLAAIEAVAVACAVDEKQIVVDLFSAQRRSIAAAKAKAAAPCASASQ